MFWLTMYVLTKTMQSGISSSFILFLLGNQLPPWKSKSTIEWLLDTVTVDLVYAFNWVVVSYFFLFSKLFGEDEPMLTNIFQMGWFNHQLVISSTIQFHKVGVSSRSL